MAKTPRARQRNTQSMPSPDTGRDDPPPSETTDGEDNLALANNQYAADDANAADQGASDAVVQGALSARDDTPDVTYTEDGGAIIDTRPREARKARSKTKHFANLLENASPELLRRISQLVHDVYEGIEVDIEAASKGVEKYATALDATGITGKAIGGGSFPGASTVTHPVLGEVCADYAARICRELLPPKGPAKPHVEGTVTKEKFERARRVARYMNFQSRKVMRNFAAELEQGLTQEPFSGAAYMKLWLEGKKPHIAFVPYDKVHRPANADEFYSCERITHELSISGRRLRAKMRKGIYCDVPLTTTVIPEQSKVDDVVDKTTGIAEPMDNVDDVRTLYETSCFWDGEDDKEIERPYILTMDKESKTPIGLYRNWSEGDAEYERLDFLYEFGFWPFMGGKPIGLSHMLSGLPRAATGALRALLDSALANNFPGAYKIKGGQSGSNNTPGPGQLSELENATGIDDIRKQVIPVSLNPPSQVLFTLLGFVVDAAKGMVRTTFDDIVGKGRQDIPVGTMMMLVDEGTVVYSSIFARQHRSMGRLLEGLFRLNQQIVDNVAFADTDGEDVVTRKDFDGDSVVVPTSDPRINSDTQRWTRANFVASRAAGGPMGPNPLYNQFEVEKMLLDAAQVENADMLLNKPATPTELSAVNENVACVLARPIVAFPEQNHMAHLEVHADFVKSPMFGQSSAMMPQVVPAMVQHFKEHMALEYAAKTMEVVDSALDNVLAEDGNERYQALFEGADSIEEKLSVVDLMREKDPDLGRKVDKLFAAASGIVLEQLGETFTQIMAMLTEMEKVAQQFKPPQPMDPTQATMAATKMTADAQQAIAGMRAQSDQQRNATAAEVAKNRAMFDQAKIAQAARDTEQKTDLGKAQVAQRALDMDTRHVMNTEDNKTALTIAAAEIADGGRTGLSNGRGINP